MTFEVFLLLVTAAYAVQSFVFIRGLRRGKDSRTEARPTVTVVIAARNEEANITKCLSSVMDQTYPSSQYSVIVANDNSSDSTLSACEAFAHKHSNLSVFTVREDESLRGKSNALAQAIDRATGEIILITDADCVVPRTWVEETADRYASPDVGLVGGMTLQQSRKAFEGMQSLDWAFILGIAASSAARGNLLGSIGNNLSFRKKAYDEVGGYRTIPFSVTEDYALVQTIVETGRWKFLYPVDERLLVVSQPCGDLRTLLRQKHRWGKGGLDMKLSGFLLLVVTGLIHLSPIMALYWGEFFLAAAVVTVRFSLDYLFLNAVLTRLNRRHELRHFFWFEMYFSFYVILLPLLARFGGKVIWKGREY